MSASSPADSHGRVVASFAMYAQAERAVERLADEAERLLGAQALR
jgi:hypothetical protein